MGKSKAPELRRPGLLASRLAQTACFRMSEGHVELHRCLLCQ